MGELRGTSLRPAAPTETHSSHRSIWGQSHVPCLKISHGGANLVGDGMWGLGFGGREEVDKMIPFAKSKALTYNTGMRSSRCDSNY